MSCEKTFAHHCSASKAAEEVRENLREAIQLVLEGNRELAWRRAMDLGIDAP